VWKDEIDIYTRSTRPGYYLRHVAPTIWDASLL